MTSSDARSKTGPSPVATSRAPMSRAVRKLWQPLLTSKAPQVALSLSIDAFLLAMTLYRRRGRAVRGVSHAAWFGVPGVAGLCRGLGLVSGEEPRLGELLGAGEPLLVLPGGSRECFRSSRVRYTLDWGQRQGYARLALRHTLPILFS